MNNPPRHVIHGPRLWVCYKLPNGELRVKCLEGVADGDGIDAASDFSDRLGAKYIYCSREKTS
jgi:hypothetical protein